MVSVAARYVGRAEDALGLAAPPAGSRGLAVAVYMHTLHFTNRAQLSWAFRYLHLSEFVQDCLTEPAELRIRFVAAPAPAAILVEQIYLRGGLTWCVRSRFTRPQPEEHSG